MITETAHSSASRDRSRSSTAWVSHNGRLLRASRTTVRCATVLRPGQLRCLSFAGGSVKAAVVNVRPARYEAPIAGVKSRKAQQRAQIL